MSGLSRDEPPRRVRLMQSLTRAARLAPEAVASIYGDRKRSWSQLQDRVARLAAGLESLDVSRGARVAILALNSDAFLETYYAALWLGACVVPLNVRLSVDELGFQLRDTEACILCFGAEFAPQASRLAEELGAGLSLIALDAPTSFAAATIDELILANPPRPDAEAGGDSLAAIYYTGGTTGVPKGVMLSHEALHAMSRNFIVSLRMAEGCVNLHTAPMFHVSAVGIFFTTMLVGTHVFSRSFDEETLLSLVENHRATHCFTVPTIIERLCRHPRAGQADLSSLQIVGYGGSPMPVSVMEMVRATLPHVGLAHGYGMTEMPAMTMLGPEDHAVLQSPRLASVGRAMPEYELRVVDANGRELEPGEIGEIIGRGPNRMLGYWRRPAETQEALGGGWMHSGDVGFIDADGYLYVTDRLKDMIVTGGENVYSIEVENILYRHPAVLECSIIGLPDADWGERVHALIGCKPGCSVDLEEIRAFCREHIAPYKAPRSLEILAEPLPRSAAGKVLKTELRAARRGE